MKHSMTQCLLFVLPVLTATEIDGAGHVQRTVVKRELCLHPSMDTRAEKRDTDKAKSLCRYEKNIKRSGKK